jgi:hypothetical protein
MEPVTAVTTAWSIVKNAGEASTKLHDLWKSVKDREIKQQIGEILDKLTELKMEAASLEDENRALREKLRFKSDAYVFRTPFWYAKDNDQQSLCPKCFSNEKPSPMGVRGQGCGGDYRMCLVCGCFIEVGEEGFRGSHVVSYPHRRR